MNKMTGQWVGKETEMGRNAKTKNDDSERVEQLATRITRASHRALQYLALDRETSVQALVQGAIDVLIAKTPRAPERT